MYTNIYYNRQDKLIHLWDDIKGYFKFPYEQYYYEKVPYNTELKSIFGDNVVKRKGYTEDLENTFERDINPEMRVLVDLYYESDDVAKNKILFIDIETDSKKGYPNIQDPDKEILSIACRDYNERKTYVFVLDKNNKFTLTNTEDTFFNVVNREYLLLQNFIAFIKNRKYTVISGYNSQYFDLPYIIKRGKKILGNQINELSPVNIIDTNKYDDIIIPGLNHLDWLLLYKKYTERGKKSYSLDNVAYIELKKRKRKYKGTLAELYDNDINEFILYNIDDVLLVEQLEDKLKYMNIAIYLSHKGHIPYHYIYHQSKIIDGAMLTYAKRNDIILQNKKDNKKIKSKITNLGKIENWKDIKDIIKIEEIEKDKEYEINIEDLNEEDLIIINNDSIITKLNKNEFEILIEENNIKISSVGNIYILPDAARGAYVKPPIKGKHKWLIDLDATSLYPSIIRTINISPETKIGKLLKWDEKNDTCNISLSEQYRNYLNNNNEKYIRNEVQLFIYKNNKTLNITFESLHSLCNEKNFSISCNGMLYQTKKRGLIPSILDLWFKERDSFKKLSKKYYKENNIQLGVEYYIKQYVMKILLNSVYGVLLLPSFRMYDMDNGEAVTITGQELIKFSENIINTYLNNKYKNEIWKDHIVIVDTDSNIINISDYVNNKDDITKLSNELQEEVNLKLNQFSDLYLDLNGKNHYFNMKQEFIGKAGLSIAKKRYIIQLIDKEGIETDELLIKGIDIIRSDFPDYFTNSLQDIILKILDDYNYEQINSLINDIRSNMINTSLLEIAKPTGVKNIDSYSDNLNRYKKGAPAHVKAAINYNILLKDLKINDIYEPIYNNEKIKYLYLKENEKNFESMAFKDNIPKEVINFIGPLIDYEKIFDSIMTNKLNAIFSLLNWPLIEMRSQPKKIKEKSYTPRTKKIKDDGNIYF